MPNIKNDGSRWGLRGKIIMIWVLILLKIVGCRNFAIPSIRNELNKIKFNELLELSAKKPHDFDLKISLGKLYLATNSYDKATDIFHEVLKKRPNNSECLLLLGEIYLKRLDMINEDPSGLFANVVNKKNGKYLIKLLKQIEPRIVINSNVTVNSKFTSEFKKYLLEKNILKMPLRFYAEKFLEKGVLEKVLNKKSDLAKDYFIKAEIFAKKAVEFDSTKGENHLLLGTVYGNLNNFDNAIDEFNRSISLLIEGNKNIKKIKMLSKLNKEKLAEAYFYLGLSYKRVQILEKIHVTPYLRFGIQLASIPINILRKLLYKKAEAFVKKDMFPNAISAFKKSIEIRPGWIESRYHLAETYFISDELDKSINEYLALKKIRKEDPNIDFSISCLYKRMGKTENAFKYMASGWDLVKRENEEKGEIKRNNFKFLYDVNRINFNWSPVILSSPYIPNCDF